MQAIIILGLIIIIISWLGGKGIVKYSLEFCFILIFLFTAFRYNYGTDYISYQRIFEEVQNHSSLFELNANDFKVELGWLYICYFFKHIGFTGLIFVLSSFFCFTYYKLIKAYVPRNLYWLALLTYIFFNQIMLIQLSALRQGLSIALFLNSFHYLVKNDRWGLKFIILNILGGLVHSSGFFMISLIFFKFSKFRNSKYTKYIILSLFLILLFFGGIASVYLPKISYLFAGDRYNSMFEVEIETTTTIVGSIFWSLMIFIVLYYSRYQNDINKLIFYLCSIFFLVYPLNVLAFLSDRMGYYFASFCIITFPLIFAFEKRKIIKYGILTVILTFIFYNFYKFFQLDWVIHGYEKYRTIFEL